MVVYVLLALGIVAFVIRELAPTPPMARGALFGLVSRCVRLDEPIHAARVADRSHRRGHRVRAASAITTWIVAAAHRVLR